MVCRLSFRTRCVCDCGAGLRVVSARFQVWACLHGRVNVAAETFSRRIEGPDYGFVGERGDFWPPPTSNIAAQHVVGYKTLYPDTKYTTSLNALDSRWA